LLGAMTLACVTASSQRRPQQIALLIRDHSGRDHTPAEHSLINLHQESGAASNRRKNRANRYK
ncbi:MAG: hypothetical protein AAFV77_11015, partial [Planctomycetota bacterium]